MRYDTRFWRGGLNLFYALLIVAASSGLRIAFLGGLGRGVAYLTYYPAVMVAAIIGGLGAGILATIASALLAWLWIQGGLLSSVEWLALGVFLLSCTMISFMAESMRRANLRALKAKEEAEAASRSKSTFLANMSHELRTPLNAVLGFSSLMRKDSSMHGRNLDYLGIINRSGSHLLNLINNILDISKIEAGRVELEPSDVDLAQLLREVGEMLRFRAREKGLELVVDTNDLPRTVRLDQGKLRQILINLTGNAIQYTRRGRVHIIASSVKCDAPEGFTLRFEIEDSGEGIPVGDRERIFRPFERLAARNPAESGTGLGLAISKQYVELMGGQIELESEPGRGSVFSFELPAALPLGDGLPADFRGGRVTGLASGQAAPRILIAEDQEENALLLQRLLEPIGAETRLVSDGREAVELFEAWRPDLVFMDIRLPVLDGKEATRLIKATAAGKDSTIVALTAHSLEEERGEIIKAGCDDFIRKPYRDSEIYAVLARELGLKYVYEGSGDGEPGSFPGLLAAGDFSALPPALLDELRKAAIELDQGRILELASGIGGEDSGTGALIADLSRNFAWERLLELLAAARPEGAGHGL